jgi:hypothetical protein
MPDEVVKPELADPVVHEVFIEKPLEVRLRKMSNKQLKGQLKPYLKKNTQQPISQIKWAVVLNIVLDSHITGRIKEYLR